MNTATNESARDLPTILAISVVAWTSFAFLHEIVGHGGAAILLGEQLKGAVSTTVHIVDFYDVERVAGRIGWWGFRTVAAAGTAVNFVAGAIALLLLRSRWITQPAARYCLWLFGSISILQQAFWLAVMPFASLGGDWTAFFIKLEPAILWKAGVTAIGILLLWIGYRVPLRLWRPAIGVVKKERRRRIRQLTVYPVLAAFAVQLLSVAWSPLSGPRHTTIVSVFSFIPLFLWLIPLRLNPWPATPGSSEVTSLGRSRGWLAAGLIAAVLFVLVLGTGIGSFDGHPSYRG